MVSRIAAFVIWASVAASAAFWLMQLLARPLSMPPYATMVSTANAFQGDLTRLFGSDAQAPVAVAGPAVVAASDPRFRLIGVVAPRNANATTEGLAVIALDSQPARAYSVGSTVDGELVLLSVHARGAAIGPKGQPAQFALELPALPPPSTGTLPATGAAPQPSRPSAAFAPSLPSRPLPPRPQAPMEQVPVEPPAAPESAPPDAQASEQMLDPSGQPIYMPPTSAGRPPT